MEDNKKPCNISISTNGTVQADGIEEILELQDNQAELKGRFGKLIIKGENLKVLSFDNEKQTFFGTGKVNAVFFKEGGSLIKKIFK